jgi:transcriptional regulator with XRE-family HTH domain
VSRIPYDVESLGPAQEAVAGRLRAFRLEQRLSLRAFADRLSKSGHPISHTAVAKYETGRLKVTADYLELVSGSFGVPYGWFISGLGDDDKGADYPALVAAGLAGLPGYAHDTVAARLEKLAVECGVPEGAERDAYFRTVGRLVLAPFLDSEGLIRGWGELTQKELMGYLTGEFALLRTLFRKPEAVAVPAPKPEEAARARRARIPRPKRAG